MRAELTLEQGGVATYSCDCCGGTSETVHGYIYDQTGATSVYFVGYTLGHPTPRANVLVSMGGWGEGTSGSDRRSTAVEAVLEGEELRLRVASPDSSPWANRQDMLGTLLREHQLTDADRARMSELVSVAVTRDPHAARYFGGRPPRWAGGAASLTDSRQ